MLGIVKDPKVISSSSDIAKIFGIKFASNPMLDDRGHPPPGPHFHVTPSLKSQKIYKVWHRGIVVSYN